MDVFGLGFATLHFRPIDAKRILDALYLGPVEDADDELIKGAVFAPPADLELFGDPEPIVHEQNDQVDLGVDPRPSGLRSDGHGSVGKVVQ